MSRNPLTCSSLSVAFLVSFTVSLLVAGCTPESTDHCTVAGERYEVGETIDVTGAPAGCEECVCDGDEDVDCAFDSTCADTCFDNGGQQRNVGEDWLQNDARCSCTLSGAVSCDTPPCQPGDTMVGACGSTCSCDEGGNWLCPDVACCGGGMPNADAPAVACDPGCIDAEGLTRFSGEVWTQGTQQCTCEFGGFANCVDVVCTEGDGTTTREPGETWDGADGRCTCDAASLTISCHPPCAWEGETYLLGDAVPVEDGCTCLCDVEGQVSCADSGCLPAFCTDDGGAHSVGDTYLSPEGCNTCLCHQDGTSYCTDRVCGDGACEYAGVVYTTDDSFSSADGCNTCTCSATGAVLCTQVACDPVTCFDGATLTSVGDNWKSANGCELCACASDGEIYCADLCAGAPTTDAGPSADGGDATADGGDATADGGA